MQDNKIKKIRKVDLEQLISENLSFIVYICVYFAGLIIGALLYKNICTKISSELFDNIFNTQANVFLDTFFSKLCIYLSVYMLTVLIGLCVIGYPTVCCVPFLCGVEIALKLSYFYNLYNFKGFGYSLLIIIPESSMFILILIYAIKSAGEMSKNLMQIARNNESKNDISIKSYLKDFLIYGSEIIVISLINAVLIHAFNQIIRL